MSDLEPVRKLTKKEKKAQAFRANKGKGKGKKEEDDQAAVPEQDDIEMAEEDREVKESGVGKESKKRKRSTEDGEEVKDGTEGEKVGEGEPEKKKKRQRGKKKSVTGGVDADGKPKLVLFIGNLPYKVTADNIKAHFTPCGEAPIVRLLTPKPSPTATPASLAKSKGCAFIQFTSSVALQAALRLHESELGGRKINVELTAGGGGNSDARKAKIDEKRKTMDAEREKIMRNKRKREGLPEDGNDKSARWGQKKSERTTEGGEEGAEKEKPKTQKKEIVINGVVKKVRDRRIPKVDASGVEKERTRKLSAKAAAASSGANSIKLG